MNKKIQKSHVANELKKSALISEKKRKDDEIKHKALDIKRSKAVPKMLKK